MYSNKLLGQLHPVLHKSAGAVIGCVATVVVLSSLNGFWSGSDQAIQSEENSDGVSDTAQETPLPAGSSSPESPTLEAIFQQESRFLQLTDLYALIEQGDVEQLLGLARQASSLGSVSDRVLVQENVFRRLAEVDLVRALELVSEFSDQDDEHMIRSIFNEWFQSDLAAAVSHAKTLPIGSRVLFVHELMQSSFNLTEDVEREIAMELGVARHYETWIVARRELAYIDDPETYWYSIADDAKMDLWGTPWLELQRVGESWIRREGINVIPRVAASLNDVGLRDRVVTHLLKDSIGLDPEGVLELARTMPGIDNEGAVLGVLASWSGLSPEGAFEVASRHHKSGIRRRHQRFVINALVHNDPAVLFEGLDGVPEEHRIWGQRQALERLARRDPDKTSDFLSKVDDTKTKLEVARQTV